MDTSYSLRKSRHILKTANKWYRTKRQILSAEQLQLFEDRLQQLDAAILKQERAEASTLAHHVEEFCRARFKKSFGAYLWEMIVAVAVALVVATIVRAMWFELMEIPTGSMRPTFKEQDHVTVTKTVFGINIPLMTRHFYFDPSLVQRTSTIIWSGENIPHLSSDALFMGIFPYTKRFIKRCMGKPGDTLYFYGGKIYGFDREGNDLVELRDNPWTARLEYIPLMNFDGRRTYSSDSTHQFVRQTIFNFFDRAIGRLRFSRQGIRGEIFSGQQWVEDQPEAQRHPHQKIQTYSDFWGIRNFALVRLLSKEQLETLTSFRAEEMEEALLYLELRHTPSLSYPLPILSDRFGAIIKGYSTVIPLQERHLKSLMSNMYTCRFIVRNGRAIPYSNEKREKIEATSPVFPGVPDGTYEFYYGQASKVGWGGITSSLPLDHPLYSQTPSHIQKLFNMGMEMNTLVAPQSADQALFPNRYLYFREGDLYTMGGVLMSKEDPFLQSFNQREQTRESLSTRQQPYVAFRDYGPPLTPEGTLDKKWMETFGLKIPEGHYLGLGDNHAMSKDSRYFGPIPQANLQGTPSLIIWPPGERWGIPNQKPYPLLTLPRLIVWGVIFLIGLVCWLIHCHNMRQPIFKKLGPKKP